MRITYYILGLFVAASLLVSCVRKNDSITPKPFPKGGKGGNAVLRVTPQHHKNDVNAARVYIKYGATTMPAINLFDDSMDVIHTFGRPMSIFEQLKQGDYYIYAKGTDSKLEPGKDEVFGGAHFKVLSHDTVATTYDLYLQMDHHIHHD